MLCFVMISQPTCDKCSKFGVFIIFTKIEYIGQKENFLVFSHLVSEQLPSIKEWNGKKFSHKMFKKTFYYFIGYLKTANIYMTKNDEDL